MNKNTIEFKKLKTFLTTPIKNGYSPVCTDVETSKTILSLGALTGQSIDLSKIKWVPETNKKTDNFLINPGDFLVSRSNTLDKVGRAALYRGGLNNCAYPDLIMKFRIDEATILPDFLEVLLQSSLARKHFMQRASGTSSSMVKITKSALESLPIPLLPLQTQKKIAELATSWKKVIKKTEVLITAKEKQFEWLTATLLNKAKYKKLVISNFICEVSSRNRDNEISRVLSVTNHSGFILPEEQFERRIASLSLLNYKIVKKGEYAYNPSRINVGSIARLDNWDNGVLSPMYVVFKLDESIVNSDYFLHWLNSSEIRQRIKKSAQGSVRETVSLADLGAIQIVLPSLEQQKLIANILNIARKEIAIFKQLSQKYHQQKNGLMKKLLTGELRIKNKEFELA